jgi:hypothetical protein
MPRVTPSRGTISSGAIGGPDDENPDDHRDSRIKRVASTAEGTCIDWKDD